jgi:hypothetical protein
MAMDNPDALSFAVRKLLNLRLIVQETVRSHNGPCTTNSSGRTDARAWPAKPYLERAEVFVARHRLFLVAPRT